MADASFDSLLPRVAEALSPARLEGRAVAVFLSGGADSLFLLHALHRLSGARARLFGLTIDYGLRGEESAQDARFARDACAALGLECRVHRAGAAPDGNLQAWARGIRRGLMRELLGRGEARYVALGHQRDDLLEGVFIKILSAQVPRPLVAVRGRILRPLLMLGRDQIEAALRGAGLSWRTDASNLEPRYRRNTLRLRALANFDSDFPQWREAALKSLGTLSGEAQAFGAMARRSPWMRAGRFKVRPGASFHRLRPAARLALLAEALRLAFPGKRFSREEFVVSLTAADFGRSLQVFRYRRWQVEYERGVFSRVETRTMDVSVNPGVAARSPWKTAVTVREGPPSLPVETPFSTPSKGPRFRLRTRMPGDRFTPAGQEGPVHLRRWLMSHKVTRQQRRRTLILLADETIAMVLTPGRRPWVDAAHHAPRHPHSWTAGVSRA
jgi:tRNA(Ile)-lysidine synthase